jgi:hypothetical protein
LTSLARVLPAQMHQYAVLADAQVGDGCQTLLPSGVAFHHWGLEFKQLSFHRVGRANATRRTASFNGCALSQHAAVPLVFRPRVSW